MKYFLSLICFGVLVSFFGSCKKDNHETAPTFDYEQAAGIWVPYEIINEAGTIERGPFLFNNFFGAYAESVQLNSDKTFIPVQWTNKDTFYLKTDEAGTFEHLSSNKLKFKGLWELDWDIIKFEGDDLWLMLNAQAGNILYKLLYKFKRQP